MCLGVLMKEMLCLCYKRRGKGVGQGVKVKSRVMNDRGGKYIGGGENL